ncbi:MAG TPA: dihydroxy-acid dehydratase, partial [Cyclobacteriaceae bacterium]|nr:dihydroxy-acid dehydratase [Cyclobacteriaceae bacterium]
LALVNDNDPIEINITTHQINLLVNEEEINKRKAAYTPRPLPVNNGVLFKYSKLVKTAADGCVTDEN